MGKEKKGGRDVSPFFFEKHFIERLTMIFQTFTMLLSDPPLILNKEV